MCGKMRDQIPSRGWWSAALCGLLGLALGGSALWASSVSGTAATPGTQATPATASSGSKSSAPKPPDARSSAQKSALAGKSSAHSSRAHKTAHKSSAGKGSSHASAQRTSSARGKKGSKNSRSSKKRGQQAIDSERATAIQEALIREHYLQGEPSGAWDSTTQAAMQKYQADQGWQSKTTPDSRALIKLGLGPSKDHLLNPESAMTAAPAAGNPKNTTKPDRDENSLPQQ